MCMMSFLIESSWIMTLKLFDCLMRTCWSFTHTACCAHARDWCRFAVSWWHTFNGQMGTDPFSNVKTHLRPWDVDGSMDTFLTRVDVAFEFFTKHLEALNSSWIELNMLNEPLWRCTLNHCLLTLPNVYTTSISCSHLVFGTWLCHLCFIFSRTLDSSLITAWAPTSAVFMTPCLAMPCHALPCLAMPCHALPCLAMPCHALP